MDQVFWEPNWREPSNEVLFDRLEKAIAKPTWVLDGNYDRTLEIKWRDVTAESFARMFSRDSILFWLLKTHKGHRERYLQKMNDSRFSHIKFYRFRSHSEADSFISAIRAHKS